MKFTDEALYEHYRKTQEDWALEELFERCRSGLTLFLYGFVKDAEDAEELMLDTFAAAISENARFKGESSFKNWLYAIGRNRAVSFLRKKRFSLVPIQEDSAKTSLEPALELIREEDKRRLYQAIEQLEPQYRQVLILVYMEDMTSEEVAAIMRKTKKQVYNLTFRGKEALKKILEETEYPFHE